MADDAWIKNFPHPTAIYVWDVATEKWVPATGAVTLSEPISVSFFDPRVAVTGFPEDTVWSGLIDDLNDDVMAEAGGLSTFGISIVVWDSWEGTLSFEASVNGVAYYPCSAVNVVTGEVVTSTTEMGNFIIPCAGYMRLRVKATSYTSGSALATLRGSIAPNPGTIPLSNAQLRASSVGIDIEGTGKDQLMYIRRLLEELIIITKEAKNAS